MRENAAGDLSRGVFPLIQLPSCVTTLGGAVTMRTEIFESARMLNARQTIKSKVSRPILYTPIIPLTAVFSVQLFHFRACCGILAG